MCEVSELEWPQAIERIDAKLFSLNAPFVNGRLYILKMRIEISILSYTLVFSH